MITIPTTALISTSSSTVCLDHEHSKHYA